ncbi:MULTISPECIES: hypothetical protein [Providencia]|uniref:hypothetical protein n=1 Tax=Providencia TaxID=586 RepID=UPI001373B6F7|nr:MULTISPECIES: hypothetical protein [Providencia]MBW3106825.1 hypothetical protein [Providencia rettgeri]BBU95067.1 hypothetical protein BML2496_09500 [Providencia rettgeri]
MSKEYPEVVCDCKLPDDCTLEVEIEFGQQKETYRQNGIKKDFFHIIEFKGKNSFLAAELSDFNNIFNIEKNPESFLPEISVPFKVKTCSKVCVSNNPECPIGNVYGDVAYDFGQSTSYNNKVAQVPQGVKPIGEVKNTFVGKVTPAKALDIPLVYTKQFRQFGAEVMNPFTVLADLFVDLWNDLDDEYAVSRLKHTQEYRLSIAECGHKPFEPKMYNASINNNILLNAGAFVYQKFGSRSVFDTKFYLILQQKTKIDLTIAFNEKTTGQNDVARKKLTAQKNQALGHNGSKPHSGWTKSGTELTTSSIKFEGSISKILGMDSKKWSAELKHEYSQLKKKKELSLLEKVNKGVDSFNRLLSTAPDKSPSKYKQQEYELAKFELIYPTIKVSGSREIALTKNNQVMPKYDVYLRGDPFFGFKFTFDMIQAFAAYFGINTIVTVIRERGTQSEGKVNRGEDGAFIGVQLDLTFNLSLNCGVKYKTESDGITKFDEKSSDVHLSFTMSCVTNIRGGFRYYGISGFFKAEAKVTAVVKAAWVPNGNGEIVFYHEGIKAYASVEYGVGIGKKETEENNDAGKFGHSKKNIKVEESTKPLDKEWIIHEPLSKEKSEYRWSIFSPSNESYGASEIW